MHHRRKNRSKTVNLLTKFTFFTLVLFFFASLSGEEKSPYRKYETENQILYFTSELDDSVISRLIDEAEKSEKFIDDLYGWKPSKKLTTVYDRELDTANGWTNIFMKRAVYLYIFPPERYSVLSSYKNWEQILHVHEYFHAAHIEMDGGLPHVANLIFGIFWFPNGMIPTWMIEGGAVYAESRIGGKGRLNSPLFKSYLYSFFEENRQLELVNLSGVTDMWLSGTFPYLYGSFFYDYLVKRYGTDGMKGLFEEIKDDFFPLVLLSRNFKKTFKERTQDVYAEFSAEYRKNALAKKTEVSEVKGDPHFSRVFADTGGETYRFFAGKQNDQGIFSFDGKVHKIRRMPTISSFSQQGSRILFTMNVPRLNRFQRSELFLADTEKRSLRRLTDNESVIEAAFGNNGEIFYISYQRGINRIVMLDSSGQTKKEWSFNALDSLYSVSLSPDGTKIAFTGNRFDQEKNIFIFDLLSEELREIEIPHDQYSVTFKDERSLVFSSEFGDKIVPMQLDLASGRVTKLCEPPLLSLFPKVIGDRVFYISFDYEGYYPASQKIAEVETDKVDVSGTVVADFSKKEELRHELKPAKGYEGMFPSLWYPTLAMDGAWRFTVGATIRGVSNDQQRSYSISYAKTFSKSDRHYLSLDYRDASVLPGFRVYFAYLHAKEEVGEHYLTTAKTDRMALGTSTTLRFKSPLFSTLSSISAVNNSLGFSLEVSGKLANVRQLKDPLNISPVVKDDIALSAGVRYGFSIDFNPGSRYLLPPMNNFTISLPLSFSQKFATERQSLVFYPSVNLSFLLTPGAKLGFITRNTLYLQFFSHEDMTVGGETAPLVLRLGNMFAENITISSRALKSRSAEGRNAFTSSNELAFHMISINQGLAPNISIAFKNLQGAVFLDIATINDGFRRKFFSAGTGFELRLTGSMGFHFPYTVSLGTSYGLRPRSGVSVYLNFGG